MSASESSVSNVDDKISRMRCKLFSVVVRKGPFTGMDSCLDLSSYEALWDESERSGNLLRRYSTRYEFVTSEARQRNLRLRSAVIKTVERWEPTNVLHTTVQSV